MTNCIPTNARVFFSKSALVLVPAVYCAVLSPSVSDCFFWADDSQALQFVESARSFRNLFCSDAFGLFRPVKNCLWVAISFLSQMGIEWCHLAAIAIGAISFFPVLALFRRILDSEPKAILAAALWLLSPTLVSSVAWLSCLNIQLMAIFAALAMTCHDSAWDTGVLRPSRICFACLFLFLSLVSYECAVAAVPLLFFFDLLLRPWRFKEKTTWTVHATYWFVFSLYLILRTASASRTTMTGAWADATRWQLIVSSPLFAIQHFSTWFWPFGRFSVFGGYRWGDVSILTLAACWCLGALILVVLVFSWKRRPLFAFSLLFAVIGFAPTSNCLGFGNGPYGDYYMTLASIGIAAGCVDAVGMLMEVKGTAKIAARAVIVIFAASRIAACFEASHWARLWSNGELAFAESVHNHPNYVSHKLSFANYLMDEGRYAEALELARQIEAELASDSPKMVAVHLVRALYAINIAKDATLAFASLESCRKANNPEVPDRMIDFYEGCVYEDLLDNPDLARRRYEQALSSGVDFMLVPCADRLARILAMDGELQSAISLWEQARSASPGNISVLWNLSIAYRETGNEEHSKILTEKIRKLTQVIQENGSSRQ